MKEKEQHDIKWTPIKYYNGNISKSFQFRLETYKFYHAPHCYHALHKTDETVQDHLSSQQVGERLEGRSLQRLCQHVRDHQLSPEPADSHFAVIQLLLHEEVAYLDVLCPVTGSAFLAQRNCGLVVLEQEQGWYIVPLMQQKVTDKYQIT